MFGDRIPPISSTKRFFGHTLAASGAIEAIVCVEALRHQQIPPNPGFTSLDPAIGLEPVTTMQAAQLTHLMSNSFGFGGNNGVLIFSQPETVVHTRPPRPGPVSITGIGVIGPGPVTIREIEPPLPPGKVAVHSCGKLTDADLLTPNQRRRVSRMVKMALIAARRSHSLDSSHRLAVALGTGLGCLEEGAIFIENFISNDERAPTPSRFSGSVHNAAAAQVAIDLGAQAMNSTLTAGEISFECALWVGLHQLAADEADAVLVGAVDELNKYPLSIGKRWGHWNEQTRPGEGAVVARLTRTERAVATLGHVRTVRLGRYRRPFNAETEGNWIAAAVDLTAVDVVLSGAKGWPLLDPKYSAVVAALSSRAGRTLEHHTYKQMCGEFHAASALGFSVSIELLRQGHRGVLLYTLSPRGSKAICFVQP